MAGQGVGRASSTGLWAGVRAEPATASHNDIEWLGHPWAIGAPDLLRTDMNDDPK